MSLVRTLRQASFLVLVATAPALVAGCGDGKEAKSAKVASGPMPEGETWTGVPARKHSKPDPKALTPPLDRKTLLAPSPKKRSGPRA